MAVLKEIKARIKSVKDTSKVTGAMYGISQMKLHSSSAELAKTEPYFNSLENELTHISSGISADECAFMRQSAEGSAGVLVITSDKGLCGDFNRQILRGAQRVIEENPGCKIYAIGEKAKKHFAANGTPFQQDFDIAVHKPDEETSARISDYFCDLFLKRKISRLIAVYSSISGTKSETVLKTVLPIEPRGSENPAADIEFLPSKAAVVDSLVPIYLSGVFHSILLHSYISEQTSRMLAMDSANKNAKQLLDELNTQYNRLRQNAITTEIAEISGERNL